jgi:alpha-galactosidase/6-phospho-beta-glucosidase family protein
MKITIVGAGSAVFARQIITDISQIRGLNSGTFALIDIDGERLELAHGIAQKIVGLLGKDWQIEASTDRRDLLANSDVVITTFLLSTAWINASATRSDRAVSSKHCAPALRGSTSCATCSSWRQTL